MTPEEKKEIAQRQSAVSRIVFGLMLLAVGLLFTLDNFGVVDAGRLEHYWPLLLIAGGLPTLLVPKDAGESVWGVFMVSLGSFFLLRRFDVIDWRIRDVWPLFLVLAGATLIVRTFLERKGPRNGGVQSLENGGTR